MSLFRLDASIRTEGSHSRQIADIVQQEWRNAHPADPVINREIGIDPLPSNAWATAVLARPTPEEDRSPEQREAVALAATLTDELAAADALLFAVPLYNFGVSQHFKTWVDLVVTDPRMGAGSDPIIAARPAVLATVHGGAYGPGTPREGWDHATGWMRRILHDVWKLDLRVVESEFTLVGVNPQLDQFKELAAQMRSEAEQLARAHGRSLSPKFRRLCSRVVEVHRHRRGRTLHATSLACISGRASDRHPPPTRKRAELEHPGGRALADVDATESLRGRR